MEFVFAPFEMFHASAKYVKDNSKTKQTMIFSVANGRFGYIPTKEAFTYGCYEVDTCPFVSGTAEAFAEGFVKLINENYEKQKEENNINKKLTIDLFKKQVDLIENFATAKTPEEFCDYFFKHFGIKI